MGYQSNTFSVRVLWTSGRSKCYPLPLRILWIEFVGGKKKDMRIFFTREDMRWIDCKSSKCSHIMGAPNPKFYTQHEKIKAGFAWKVRSGLQICKCGTIQDEANDECAKCQKSLIYEAPPLPEGVDMEMIPIRDLGRTGSEFYYRVRGTPVCRIISGTNLWLHLH